MADNPVEENAAGWLAEQLPAMDLALAALVEINSFTDNPDGGRKVGELLRGLFSIDGLSCEVVRSERYADHLVFRSEGNPRKPPLALLGHLDTVFPPGKFEGYVKEGNVRRGPGVFDMKGGLVVIAFALKALAQEPGGLGALPPLRIVVVADEEVGSPEGQGLIRSVIEGCQGCLVFESGRAKDAIVTRRKGVASVTAVAHGKAAHAGNNHKDGHNAIWALARFIDAAQRITDYERGVTVNVGKVQGGQGKNTVPDLAEAFLDLRFSTRADSQATYAALEKAAQEAAASVPGTRMEIQRGPAREPMESSEASLAMMHAYGACALKCGLEYSEAPLMGGGSDANTATALGVPSIDGLGPRGKGFHTLDEQIEVDSLIWKSQALARYLASR
ncbi:MAG TPA: M20 family metallopeptidase [Myxococcaceae bacterium]|nr:M20 family metallopeptidase [Myxococcaceae bacterium]